MSAPIVLAFDTSGPHCAVALCSGGRVLAQRVAPMARGQAERLMPLLETVLADADAGWTDLAALGVGVGPGNFTGIRISVAASRGLSLALGVPAVGVSALEAAAHARHRPVIGMVPALRGLVYAQRFAPDGPGPVALWDMATLAAQSRDTPICSHDLAWLEAAGLEMRHRAPSRPLAVAIAEIAAGRHERPDLPRPAPLYVRPADAAPPREAPPVILDDA